MNNLGAFPRVLAGDCQIYLQVGGIPELARGNQGQGVPHHARADGNRLARADDLQPVDTVRPQALARKVAFPAVQGALRRRCKRSRCVIASDRALASRDIAGCLRMGDGIQKDDVTQPGLLTRIGRNPGAAFAVDPAFAVPGKARLDMPYLHASVFEVASPFDAVAARERLPRDRKDHDAGNVHLGAAIRSARWVSGFLRRKSAGKNQGSNQPEAGFHDAPHCRVPGV